MTLSCVSSSDSSGSGAYVWNLGGQSVYVLSGLLASICYIVKDITINCLRNGATSQTYPVPNSDDSSAGDYTCTVTAHTIESSESSAFSFGVTGILTFKAYQTHCSSYVNIIYKISRNITILQLQLLLFLYQAVPPIMKLVELL